MLKEALELIQKSARDAADLKSLYTENPHQTRVLLRDGVIDVVQAAFPPRKHEVYDLQSLADWSVRTDSTTAVIWHNDEQVVLVLDDAAYRENTVELPLPKHPKFSALERLDESLPKTQKELLSFLRLNLKAEIDAAVPGFIGLLREIRIAQQSTGSAAVQHGRESMGRTIDNSVTGADAIPEDFSVQVPLWLHLDCRVELEMAFDIDVEQAKFALRPKPGELEKALADGQHWLHNRLVAECADAVVYFGVLENRCR